MEIKHTNSRSLNPLLYSSTVVDLASLEAAAADSSLSYEARAEARAALKKAKQQLNIGSPVTSRASSASAASRVADQSRWDKIRKSGRISCQDDKDAWVVRSELL